MARQELNTIIYVRRIRNYENILRAQRAKTKGVHAG